MDVQIFVGRKVIIYFASDGAKFRYEGKLLHIDYSTVIINDLKEGAVILPFQACQIKAGEIDG